MKEYTQNFYIERHKRTVYSAETILSLVLKHLPKCESAVDLGCGVGTWLSVLKQMGFYEVYGFDGKWVDKKFLEIPKEFFTEIDLAKSIKIDRRFDLAISLEVAEHLPPERAMYFIESLTNLSDFVLFSAAIPFQDGLNHLNEQWPEYWSEMFERQGFVHVDFIRRVIWNDSNIPFWYKQNILLFVKRERLCDLKYSNHNYEKVYSQLSMVHPELYIQKNVAPPSIKESGKRLAVATRNWIIKMALAIIRNCKSCFFVKF